MTFVMMKQIGGNPFRKTERNVPPAIQANLERKFNLDKPWYQQYAYYVKDVATFDLGRRCRSARARSTTSSRTGSRSLKLGILAFLWAVVLGIPLGVLAALKPNSIFDYFAMFFSSHRLRIAELLRRHAAHLLRGAEVGSVPTNGWPQGFFEFDNRVILPSFALGLFPMATSRASSRSMLETMQQDYVRTARAKGLARRIVGSTSCATR